MSQREHHLIKEQEEKRKKEEKDNTIFHNPITNRNYEIKHHSSKYNKTKDIKGLWEKV